MVSVAFANDLYLMIVNGRRFTTYFDKIKMFFPEFCPCFWVKRKEIFYLPREQTNRIPAVSKNKLKA